MLPSKNATYDVRIGVSRAVGPTCGSSSSIAIYTFKQLPYWKVHHASVYHLLQVVPNCKGFVPPPPPPKMVPISSLTTCLVYIILLWTITIMSYHRAAEYRLPRRHSCCVGLEDRSYLVTKIRHILIAWVSPCADCLRIVTRNTMIPSRNNDRHTIAPSANRRLTQVQVYTDPTEIGEYFLRTFRAMHVTVSR